jgi:ribose/xylose/arabinose/galactoside ABC-type transport system permease subunit
MFHLTVWVAAVILQSALLGRNMYAVGGSDCDLLYSESMREL